MPLTPIDQDKFIELISKPPVYRVSNVEMTTPATLGNYNQSKVPENKSMSIQGSTLTHLEFQTPPQSALEIAGSTIGSIQLGEGGKLNNLRITQRSKIKKLTIIPAIGGRVREVQVTDSDCDEFSLFGDYNNANYLNSVRFDRSTCKKFSLSQLNLGGDVLLALGNTIDTVELINVQVNGKLVLDGVKNIRIVNGKYRDISVTGPTTTLEIISDGGAQMTMEQLNIALTPGAKLPSIDTTGGNVKINDLMKGVKVVVRELRII